MTYFLFSLWIFTTIALAVEATFTSLGFQFMALFRRHKIDWGFPSQTSIWALPVYGLSAAVSYTLIGARFPGFFEWPWFCRGLTYMAVIYAWEFFWGWIIERATGKCPWQYFNSPWGVWRYTNPYYAPFWFGFGFLLEKIHLYLIPHLWLLFAS